MHNYDKNGEKMYVLGGYIDFKVGIFYSLTPIKESKKKEGKKGNKRKKQKSEGHLPFAR
jgi:hypothetical protein